MFVPPPPPTARARELGQRIAQLVRDYRAESRSMSGIEVRQAFLVARSELGREGGGNPQLIIGVVIGLIALLGLAVLLFLRQDGAASPTTIIWLVAGVTIVVGIAAAFSAFRS